MADRDGAGRDVLVILAPLAVLLLLALWVSSSGVVFVVGDPYRNLEQDQPEPTFQPSRPPPPPTAAPERNLPEPWWLNLGVWLILAVAALAVGYLCYRLLRWVRARRVPLALDPPPVPSVAATVLADAGEQLAALVGGPPANAIIACWRRLEAAIAAAGAPALAWETPAEVTAAVLREFDVDEDALADLLGLYHEARFSAHEINEPERARAIAALERIHAGLARHTDFAGADRSTPDGERGGSAGEAT